MLKICIIKYTPKGLELSDASNTVDRVAVQFVIRQEKGTFNRSFNILQASLKIWVQHVKTIPGNLLLTVKMIIQIEHFEENYGNKL